MSSEALQIIKEGVVQNYQKKVNAINTIIKHLNGMADTEEKEGLLVRRTEYEDAFRVKISYDTYRTEITIYTTEIYDRWVATKSALVIEIIEDVINEKLEQELKKEISKLKSKRETDALNRVFR